MNDYSIQRLTFLAELGYAPAINQCQAREISISPLTFDRSAFWYWQPDPQWRRWKRHLSSAGRYAAVLLAISEIELTSDLYRDHTNDNSLLPEILSDIRKWINSKQAGDKLILPKHDNALANYDKLWTEGSIPYSARSALIAATSIADMVSSSIYLFRCRQALWYVYLALSGPLTEFSEAQDSAIREMMLAVAQSTLISWGTNSSKSVSGIQ